MYLPISISFPTFFLPRLSLSPFTGSRKKPLLCFLSSHLILPDLPLLEGSFPSGTFVLGADEYGRALQRLLCFWDASQVPPPAPSPSSLNPNSSCSDAIVVTHFFQPDGWKRDISDAWSFEICSLIRPPGVYSQRCILCACVVLEGGRRGPLEHTVLEHTLCFLPVCRLALTVGHSLKPHPPAEVERAWDALEGQRDAIEFDRTCTTN